MAALVFSKPGYHEMNIISHFFGYKMAGAAGGKLIKPFQTWFMGPGPPMGTAGFQAKTD